jgi:hypothetical protein
MAAVVAFDVGGPVLKWMVAMLTQRVFTIADEMIQATVTAWASGLLLDPTIYAVSWSFQADSSPPPLIDPSWKAGTWDVSTTGNYVAQIRSGATGAALAAGEYYAFIKIVAGTETVVRQIGKVIAR